MGYQELELQDVVTCVPESGWYYITLVWKNLVTDLLSVRTIVGLLASHRMCPYSKKAWLIARNSLEYIDIFICAGVKTLDPKAINCFPAIGCLSDKLHILSRVWFNLLQNVEESFTDVGCFVCFKKFVE